MIAASEHRRFYFLFVGEQGTRESESKLSDEGVKRSESQEQSVPTHKLKIKQTNTASVVVCLSFFFFVIVEEGGVHAQKI